MSDSITQRYHQALDHLTASLDDPAHADTPLDQRLATAHRVLLSQGATREDADTAIEWVREDLNALGLDLERRGLDLGDWLQLDVRLLRDALLDTLRSAADPTRLGWQRLALELAAARRDAHAPRSPRSPRSSRDAHTGGSPHAQSDTHHHHRHHGNDD